MNILLLPGLLLSILLAVPASLYSQNLIKTMLRSEKLQQDRALGIHLPSRYDSTKKYPVLYVLDGLSQSEHLARKFDSLSVAGSAPQTIVVGIPNMSAENRLLQLIPPYMKIDSDKKDSPGGEAETFLAFMESELIPFMERTYAASNIRSFAGNSRGGLLVMHSLISKPDLFQARFCFSTPFWREDNIIVSKVSDFLRSRDSLHTFLYMSAGEQETENIKNGLAAMAKAFGEKAAKGLVWFAEYTPNADHQSNAEISATMGIRRWSEFLKK